MGKAANNQSGSSVTLAGGLDFRRFSRYNVSMKDKRENDIQFEKMRDTAERFVAERYISDGFYMHFHRNPELYCVCAGEVIVTVNGESRVLTDGQMALISGLESHSYEVEHTADIAYFHIGTKYTEPFRNLYKGKSPAHWLTDRTFNESEIFPLVETVMREGETMTELERVSYGNLLLARIVKRYGINEKSTYFAGGGEDHRHYPVYLRQLGRGLKPVHTRRKIRVRPAGALP